MPFSRDVEYYARNFGAPRGATTAKASGEEGDGGGMKDGDEVEDEEAFEAEVASRKANIEVIYREVIAKRRRLRGCG
jgi:hypothetical protein